MRFEPQLHEEVFVVHQIEERETCIDARGRQNLKERMLPVVSAVSAAAEIVRTQLWTKVNRELVSTFNGGLGTMLK